MRNIQTCSDTYMEILKLLPIVPSDGILHPLTLLMLVADLNDSRLLP